MLSAVFLLSARPMATLVATESCGLIELHSQQPRRQSSWRFMSALSCAEPIADEREFIAAFLPERSEVLPPTFMWRKKDLPRPDDTVGFGGCSRLTRFKRRSSSSELLGSVLADSLLVRLAPSRAPAMSGKRRC